MNRWLLPCAVLLAAACATVRPTPTPTAAPVAPEPQPVQTRSGWLMNRAQMHQAEHRVDDAVDTLGEALKDDPDEEFTHQLLVQTLVHGYGLGDEALEVYEHLVDAQPERPIAVVHAVAATLEQHRTDRFIGPGLPWLDASLWRTEALAMDETAPLRARHEALIARRNLLFLIKDRDGAREAGVAAFELMPGRLQGRITRLAQVVRDDDVEAATALCLGILETDPWAVEACSLPWGLEGEEADAAKERILAAVAALHERALTDEVIANEVHKFYDRIKDQERRRAFFGDMQRAHPDFRARNSARWYDNGPRGGTRYLELLQGTNRALGVEDLEQRLARLDALDALVPDVLEPDLAVVRYFRARRSTGEKLGRSDVEIAALEALCDVDDDPTWCLDLADRTDDVTERLAVIHQAMTSLEAHLAWVPGPDGRARFEFVTWADEAAALVVRARDAEAETLAALGDGEPWTSPLVDAWPTERRAERWAALAAADAAPGPLVLHAWLQALALRPVDAGDPDPGWRDAALERFSRTFVMVEAAGAEPWPALLAAVDARRLRLEQDPPSKQAHPFVGQPNPGLTATDLLGDEFDLEQLRGRVVLVDFWATWCGPCIKELPLLMQAMERLDGEPVTLLAVSVDNEVDVVPPFLAQRGWTSGEGGLQVVWAGPRGAKERWLVRGIPSLFVVDPTGVVRYHHQGYSSEVGVQVEHEALSLLPR